ncbi:hypothetical protein AC062_2317 [Pasteurellaceae bacterium NI1060]|nr:hypothetical protein AC062_2317 [Pasteurellaceae bacterium NI1060]
MIVRQNELDFAQPYLDKILTINLSHSINYTDKVLQRLKIALFVLF